ncbi:hypothetical protein [Vitiosangium sp. GDMCC 1.1324]|uniref:hypothetical protein n=1 Tax=Vitiosangium sp. (strain GDMCC 1.1324) TaxID=2138576 RepID=UPI000D361FFA|nr:hypothetical protein [Vitiosangium sp. GDMCC 1.1324]PTL80978.1 hypothetical protein DAT35_27035 [Vitiosangium sp. GDMCC 1.1324]
MATQHKVGGEVDAFCTRCRLTLAHTILAMVGTKIARVRCNTCNGDHAFRSAPGTTDRPSPSASRSSSGGTGGTRAPRASRSSEEKVIISFEEQLAGKDIANAPRYSPKDTYQMDQVIQHPTFGLGLVTAVRGDKVDITFKSETKTLVHGRAGAPTEKPVFSPPSAKATGPADKPQAGTPEEPASPPASPAEG